MSTETQGHPETPKNIDAEEALLSGLILDFNRMANVSDLVIPGDFYDETNATIYKALKKMHGEGVPFDITLLVDQLRQSGELEKAGGVPRVAEIINFSSTSANVSFYAGLVLKESANRAMLIAGEAIRRDGWDRTVDPGPAVEQAMQELARIQAKAEAAKGRKATVKTTAQIIDDIEQEEILQECGLGDVSAADCPEGVIRTVPLPFNELNGDLGGGIRSGELVVVAARPSHGKTAFALNCFNAMLASGRRAFFACFEMTGPDLVNRLICARANVNLKRLRGRTLDPDSFRAYLETREALKLETNGLHLTGSSANFRSVMNEIRKAHAEGPLDAVFLDYLQLMEMPGRESRAEKLAKMTRELKTTAGELNLPIVLLSQVNRESGNAQRPPRMSELRESGSIEQDADIVLMIHRDSLYRDQKNIDSPDDCDWLRYVPEEATYADLADVVIEKQRNGARSQRQFLYFQKWTRFAEQGDYESSNQPF